MTEMTLERACEVLNRVKHHGRTDWRVSCDVITAPSRTGKPHAVATGCPIVYTEFMGIAVAAWLDRDSTRLVWSSEPPKVPGNYYCDTRKCVIDFDAEAVRTGVLHGGLLLAEEFKRFAGPIPEPVEPKEGES